MEKTCALWFAELARPVHVFVVRSLCLPCIGNISRCLVSVLDAGSFRHACVARRPTRARPTATEFPSYCSSQGLKQPPSTAGWPASAKAIETAVVTTRQPGNLWPQAPGEVSLSALGHEPLIPAGHSDAPGTDCRGQASMTASNCSGGGTLQLTQCGSTKHLRY